MSTVFVNGNGNLSLIKGQVVYEIPFNNPEQAQRLAAKATSGDPDIRLLIEKVATGATSVGNRHELETRGSNLIKVWNKAPMYREHTR